MREPHERHTVDPDHSLRQLRLLAILRSSERAGLIPLRSNQLHTMAYFVDVLAPVWRANVIDTLRLKQERGPWSPRLQLDVDHLVGRGLLIPRDVEYVSDVGNSWRLDYGMTLNHDLADPVLHSADRLERFHTLLDYVEEIVFAVSALGDAAINKAALVDETYSNPMVDMGGLLELLQGTSPGNLSVRLANRIAEVARPVTRLTDSELAHVYVRHLNSKIDDVA